MILLVCRYSASIMFRLNNLTKACNLDYLCTCGKVGITALMLAITLEISHSYKGGFSFRCII